MGIYRASYKKGQLKYSMDPQDNNCLPGSLKGVCVLVCLGVREHTYLVVSQQPSLLCVRSSRPRSRCWCPKSCVRWVLQDEVMSIGGESNKELLSRGTIALPVVHSVILYKNITVQACARLCRQDSEFLKVLISGVITVICGTHSQTVLTTLR